MPEQPVELKKLVDVATSMEYPSKLRQEAIQSMSRIGSHEALLALLALAGNERLLRQERELALKFAMKMVKSSR